MMPQRKYILVSVLNIVTTIFLLTNFVSEMHHLVASSVSATLSVRVCCTLSACSLKSWLVLDSVLPMMPLNLSMIKVIHCTFSQNMTEKHDFKLDKPDACLPLLFCQTNVVVGECLPISWQTLGNIVQSFARFTLDVAPGVLQIDTTWVWTIKFNYLQFVQLATSIDKKMYLDWLSFSFF